MAKKKKLIIIAIVIAAAAVITVVYFGTRSKRNPNIIRVSGNIEITDAELSFKIGGHVKERLVDEGEMIKKGQLVALLEDKDLQDDVAAKKAQVSAVQYTLDELLAGSRPEEIAAAKAEMERAEAALQELLAGSRKEEIAQAKAAVEKAEADAAFLKKEYERQKNLYEEDAIPKQAYDKALALYQAAEAALATTQEQLKLVVAGPRQEQIDQARAAFNQATQNYMLLKKGPRKETIEQVRANLEQAKAALALAETRLSYAALTSPFSGVVLSKFTEAGEFVAPGTPIVSIGNMVNAWLRAYINESDLGRVKVGQKARITTDSYPGKVYEGRVSFIASEAEFTPKNVQTKEERVKLVYRVKIDITNPNMELKAGMPADAEIILQEKANNGSDKD